MGSCWLKVPYILCAREDFLQTNINVLPAEVVGFINWCIRKVHYISCPRLKKLQLWKCLSIDMPSRDVPSLSVFLAKRVKWCHDFTWHHYVILWNTWHVKVNPYTRFWVLMSNKLTMSWQMHTHTDNAGKQDHFYNLDSWHVKDKTAGVYDNYPIITRYCLNIV